MPEYNCITLPCRAKDLAGQIFGRLHVISPVGKSRYGNIRWLCECECGNEHVVNAGDFNHGHTKSCGCLRDEVIEACRYKHGMRHSAIYDVWCGIISRCKNKNLKSYKYYGGRGIKVCNRWRKFENFYDDMGDIPDGKTIDRINNDGDYTPENCQWATRKQQCRNKTNNRMMTYNGKTMCVVEWAEELGIKGKTIYNRLEAGWPDVKALTTPPKKQGRHSVII